MTHQSVVHGGISIPSISALGQSRKLQTDQCRLLCPPKTRHRNPIWGFTWYFNTESWATGVYQKMTQLRVDPCQGGPPIWRRIVGGDRNRERAAVQRNPGQEPSARTGEPEQITIPAHGQRIGLSEILKQLGLLFGGQADAGISNHKFQVAASVVTNAGKAKYTGLHALRHFYASWCINRKEDGGLGRPLKVVQHRLGHSSIQMTADVYGHLFPSGDDGAELAAAQKALLG
jgi:hypothetical protein